MGNLFKRQGPSVFVGKDLEEETRRSTVALTKWVQCVNFRQVVGQSTGALLNIHFGEILSLHFAKDPAGIRLDHRRKAEDGLPLTDEALFANLSGPIVKLAEKILMDSLKVFKIEIPSRNIVVTLLRFNKLRVCDLTL